MPRDSTTQTPLPSEAHDSSYVPTTPADWEDTDPVSTGEAHDRVAAGRAGVCLVTDTNPTNPAHGQIFVNTAASGDAGLGLWNIRTVTVDTTLDNSYFAVLCDTSSGPIALTLPPAASNNERAYRIKNIGPNPVTINPDGSETIDESLTKILPRRYLAATIACDGTEWWIF